MRGARNLSGTYLRLAQPEYFRMLARRCMNSHFVRHVAVLAGGTALARALTVCASPVLTRLYTPVDFGLFAVFFSVVTSAVLVAALNYDQAIPVPKEDELAVGVVAWAFCLLFANTAGLALVVVFLRTQIASLLGAPSLAPYLWLVPVSVFGGGTFYILNSWAIRTGSFKSLSKRRIWQSVFQVLAQLSVPAIARGPLGLFLGDSIGRAAGSTALMREMHQYMVQHRVRVKARMVAKAARVYWRYPTYGLSALILHTSLSVLPPLLLTAKFGLSVTGAFSLVTQVVGVAAGLIGLSVAQVYFNKAAELARNDPGRLFDLYLKTSGICAAIAAGPFVLLGCFGPFLFTTVFGAKWHQAGEFARILATPYFITFVVGPVFPVLTILQRQKWQLAVDGAGVAAMVALILTAAHFGLGARYAIGAYAVSMTLTYISLYAAAGFATCRLRRSPELDGFTRGCKCPH